MNSNTSTPTPSFTQRPSSSVRGYHHAVTNIPAMNQHEPADQMQLTRSPHVGCNGVWLVSSDGTIAGCTRSHVEAMSGRRFGKTGFKLIM